MKKLIALLVAVALLVSASATVFAMSSTPVTKKDSGHYNENGTSYYYNCQVTARTLSASVSMTYDNPNTTIHTSITATLKVDGKTRYNTANDSNNNSVSASVNNRWWTGTYYQRGTITFANGAFYIRSYNITTLSID